MNRPHGLAVPHLVLCLEWAALFGLVLATQDHLPPRVATHFGLGGEANGWMTREAFVQFALVSGFVVPLIIVGLFSLIRWSNGVGCNLPHRAYWLAPERRDETLCYLQRHGGWLACLFVVFLAGLHVLVIQANQHTPARLPGFPLALLAAFFLGGILVMTVILLRHFKAPEPRTARLKT